jgi:hypothetical protein
MLLQAAWEAMEYFHLGFSWHTMLVSILKSYWVHGTLESSVTSVRYTSLISNKNGTVPNNSCIHSSTLLCTDTIGREENIQVYLSSSPSMIRVCNARHTFTWKLCWNWLY